MLRERFNENGEYAQLRDAAALDHATTRSFDDFLKAAANISGVEPLSTTLTQPTTTLKTNAGLGMGA